MQMIDVKAAREFVETNYICDPLLRHLFLTLLDQLPKVEVVRCKDCKHMYNGKDCTHPLLLSYSWGAIRNVKDYDFCSYGERR